MRKHVCFVITRTLRFSLFFRHGPCSTRCDLPPVKTRGFSRDASDRRTLHTVYYYLLAYGFVSFSVRAPNEGHINPLRATLWCFHSLACLRFRRLTFVCYLLFSNAVRRRRRVLRFSCRRRVAVGNHPVRRRVVTPWKTYDIRTSARPAISFCPFLSSSVVTALRVYF